MKYFDTQTGIGTNTYRDDTTTIPSNDESVKEFFKPLPSGYRLEYDVDGLPLIVEIPAPTQDEIDKQVKTTRIAEIDTRFIEIDEKSMRSLRTLAYNPDDTFAVNKLGAFEEELIPLRVEKFNLESLLNNLGDWASLTGTLNMRASVNHNAKVWILKADLADVTASEPTVSNTDWEEYIEG